MKKSKDFHKKLEKRSGTEQEGLLVGLFGAEAEIEDSHGQIIRCHLRKNREPVITGDRVLWRMEKNNTGVVIDCLPRKSLLARSERPGKIKPIAANIDAMIIVTAPPPALSEYLIDRHLITAEKLKIPPIILLNKMDLLTEDNTSLVTEQMTIYKKIGYQVIYSSTYSKEGMTLLETFLREKTCVLVGVSGVGKSSIIAYLAPDQVIKIGETSAAGAGKHTTTMTRLYHLKQGGHLIDSPGIREFGLGHMSKQDILQGFIEFKPFISECKFRNCQHMKEPDCAVKKAVEEGKISAKRFASFTEMVLELA